MKLFKFCSDCDRRGYGHYCQNCSNQSRWTHQYTPPPMPTIKPARKQTNSDKVRAMSDEELADFMQEGCNACVYKGDPAHDCSPHECQVGALAWLRQEAEK